MMPTLHPAVIANIQAMHNDLADMLDNPQDYEVTEPLELACMLLDLYEIILQQHGILNFEKQVH